MVFSSVPLYLDPPNWQQLSNQQLQGHHEQNQHHLISPPQQTPQPQPQPNQMGIISGGGGSMGSQAQQIRANSMSERARLAKIPPPEVPQKCPRCDSTNTKFCYYNNYSLSQPRHFCKTCRRYWTRGGALRNVPVGGGCRRNNKRSSSSKSSSSGGGATSSKSTTSMVMDQLGNNNDPRGINVNSFNGVGNSSSMSFMASLHNIGQLGGMSNMGLNFNGVNSNSTPLGVGGNYSNHHHNNLEFPQQVVQFPNFLGGFEIPSHQFQNLIQNHHNNQAVGGVNEDQDQQEGQMNVVNNMSKGSNSSVISSVKMEENGQLGRINIAKQLMMGISSSNDSNNNNVRENDNQFWGGNMTNNMGGVTSMWTDLSGLSSSSTSQLL